MDVACRFMCSSLAVCKFKAHKRCAVRATNNCKWTTLASIGKDIIEDEDGVCLQGLYLWGQPAQLPPCTMPSSCVLTPHTYFLRGSHWGQCPSQQFVGDCASQLCPDAWESSFTLAK
jgi:hypothetical protein